MITEQKGARGGESKCVCVRGEVYGKKLNAFHFTIDIFDIFSFFLSVDRRLSLTLQPIAQFDIWNFSSLLLNYIRSGHACTYKIYIRIAHSKCIHLINCNCWRLKMGGSKGGEKGYQWLLCKNHTCAHTYPLDGFMTLSLSHTDTIYLYLSIDRKNELNSIFSYFLSEKNPNIPHK